MIKLCKICNQEFKVKVYNGSLCSDKCKQENKKLIAQVFKNKNINYFSKYAQDNKERLSSYGKSWYESNHQQKVKTNKNWYVSNKEHVSQTHKEYYRKNKDKLIEQARIYSQNRRQKDPIYKLIKNLRKRLNFAIKNNSKVGSAIRDLGCPIAKFKIQLQLKFHRNPRDNHEYMTWDNYGEWHIDHIKPLNLFNLADPIQLKEACNYINLQPLWAKDNILKGDRYEF